MPTTVPLLLTIIASALVPFVTCETARSILKVPRRHSYHVPVGLGILVGIIVLYVERRLRLPIDEIRNPQWHAIALSFVVGAIPEETLKLCAFVIWLKVSLHRQGHEAILAALAVAMGFSLLETALLLMQFADSYANWAVMLAQRTIFVFPSAAASGLVIGIWGSMPSAREGPRLARNLEFALLVAIMAHGVWDSSVYMVVELVHPQRLLAAWASMAPGWIASLAIDGIAIGIGVRQLRRHVGGTPNIE